jgi:hypothetical protein
MAGDFSNFTPTYPATDPDCWWTYHQCVTPKVGNLSADVASVPEVSFFSWFHDPFLLLSLSLSLPFPFPFPFIAPLPRGHLLILFVNHSYIVTPTHFIRSLANPRSAHHQPRTLGYGFDDGPNCSHNAFYDYLNERGQKASEWRVLSPLLFLSLPTVPSSSLLLPFFSASPLSAFFPFPLHLLLESFSFIVYFLFANLRFKAMFYIGSNVLDWPLEAQRAVADGHEVCVREYPLFCSFLFFSSNFVLGRIFLGLWIFFMDARL